MVQIVFDDTALVPAQIRSEFGVDRFGDLVFRRRSWLETMNALAQEAGWPSMIHLRNKADISALLERVRRMDDEILYLICPSHLFPACGLDSLETFLHQVQFSPTALYMFLQDERGRRGTSTLWNASRTPLSNDPTIAKNSSESLIFSD
jgi:hypothetical protein